MKELQFSCPNSPQRRLLVLTLFGGKESEVRREPFAASRDAGGGKVVGGEPLLSKKRMFCLHSIQKRKKLKTHSEVFSFLRETKPHFKLLHLYGAGVCSLAIDNFHSIISSCCHEPGYQGLSPARWKPPQGRTKQGQPSPLVKSTDSLIHHV